MNGKPRSKKCWTILLFLKGEKMRILITDDDSRRYTRLFEALALIGINRSNIELVPSANAARDLLAKERFDLLILDILLPLWPECEPDIRHSLDLLVELHEGDELCKPGHIIGITAEKDIAGEASVSFGERTWIVIEYSETNDEWINRIVNCAQYIQTESTKKTSNSLKFCVDLAIICALEKPEMEEVLKLPWNWSSARPIDDIVFIRDGYFDVDGRRITVCATCAPRMGMVSTALRSANIISLLKPRLIAMCGICAGVRGKVSIGDVILADPAWDFQSGKRVRDKENVQFSIAPHQLPAPVLVRTHVEQIKNDKTALREIVDGFSDPASDTLRVHIGPLASGSAVLADGDVVNEIKLQNRELLGVEMEIYGMYAAASVASIPQPLAFALKAVCDFADPDKEDKFQRYAAYTSANVLRLLMERFGTRILG
jgi:nucleoside phosphorylase/CheY-like chemotaxis protein